VYSPFVNVTISMLIVNRDNSDFDLVHDYGPI
jgi:hypothetical protein